MSAELRRTLDGIQHALYRIFEGEISEAAASDRTDAVEGDTWGMFFTTSHAHAAYELERDDANGWFDDDDQVLRHCLARGLAGSRGHLAAVALEAIGRLSTMPTEPAGRFDLHHHRFQTRDPRDPGSDVCLYCHRPRREL